MSPTAEPQYSHPLLSERAIDESRPLKVAYIGAGMSGVIAGILLPQRIRNLDLTIYEKNKDVGGTWLENIYPGCACDIPAHAYQLSFESNVAWSRFYVSAAEIQEYWSRVADKYSVRRLIKFEHELTEARWNNETSQWQVKVKNTQLGETIKDNVDVLISGQGILNDWKWPGIEGLHEFKGKLLHSARWDPSYDAKDKNVAVIGCGSSGIQLVAALQPVVKHMDHYARNPTWISTTYGHDFVRTRNHGEDGNFSYAPSEISDWKSKPQEYLAYRHSLELAMQKGYMVTHRDSPQSLGARQFFESEMHRRLGHDSSFTLHLIPKFPPLCRRLTPGPGYLEALTASNVTVIPTSISRVTRTGIITTDSVHRKVDTIICATGFNTTFLNRLPIYGRDGTTSLTDHYTKCRPESYLSLTLHDFPNFFQASGGPNSGHVTGNYVIYLERVHAYICQLLSRLSQSHVRTIEPKSEAVKGFTDHCEAFFERTVFSLDCASWYKSPRFPGGNKGPNEGRVTGLWPGSCLHAMKAFESVRWEDYIVGVSNDDRKAACAWLGNGFTWDEVVDDDEGIVGFLNLSGTITDLRED